MIVTAKGNPNDQVVAYQFQPRDISDILTTINNHKDTRVSKASASEIHFCVRSESVVGWLNVYLWHWDWIIYSESGAYLTSLSDDTFNSLYEYVE